MIVVRTAECTAALREDRISRLLCIKGNNEKLPFAIWLYQDGHQKLPLNYRTEAERDAEFKRIMEACADQQDSEEIESLRTEIESMREAMRKTDLQLKKWQEQQKEPKKKKAPAKKELKEEEARELVKEAGLQEEVEEALLTWLQYKYEKRQPYQPTGLKALITKARNNAKQHGCEAVVDVISTSASSGYQGIVWDRIKKGTAKKENQFNSFTQNTYTDEELAELENV